MNSIIIHGHRGSRGTSPENTIPSFKEARDAHAEFVELDVHLNKDEELIVFHDFTISGKLCRDAQGNPVKAPVALKDLTTAQIKTYDCGAPDAKIPTLRELIEWKLKEAPNLRLNIEIKREDPTLPRVPAAGQLAGSVIALLREFNLLDESLVQSFDFEVVRAARRLESKLRLSCLFENPADFAKETIDNQAQVAAIRYPLLNAQNVKRCQEMGLEVLPWTVNDEKEWVRLIDIGVRSIITDYPKRLREFSETE